MRPNISRSRVRVLVGVGWIAVAIVFFLTLGSAGRVYPVTPISLSDRDASQISDLRSPVRLWIPSIKVDAAVTDVGLTPQGAMDAPQGPSDVAWLDTGPLPGERGSAVIAGHEGWKDNVQAVFDELYELRKGDALYVENGRGAKMTFVVRDIRTYDENGDTSPVFSSSDGKAHLNLVTCEGTWDSAKKSYENRLVVFADMATGS